MSLSLIELPDEDAASRHPDRSRGKPRAEDAVHCTGFLSQGGYEVINTCCLKPRHLWSLVTWQPVTKRLCKSHCTVKVPYCPLSVSSSPSLPQPGSPRVRAPLPPGPLSYPSPSLCPALVWTAPPADAPSLPPA